MAGEIRSIGSAAESNNRPAGRFVLPVVTLRGAGVQMEPGSPGSFVVTARRDAQYLIDLGDGRGMIYDADEDILYPPKSVLTLSAQPYWGDPGDLPANLQETLDDLNAPSELISAVTDAQTACRDVSASVRHSFQELVPQRVRSFGGDDGHEAGRPFDA